MLTSCARKCLSATCASTVDFQVHLNILCCVYGKFMLWKNAVIYTASLWGCVGLVVK